MAKTGQELVDEARQKSDTVGWAGMTDAQILTFVNAGVKWYYWKIVTIDESYSMHQVDFTLVSALSTSPVPSTPNGNAARLPATFFRAQGLDMNPGTDQARTVGVFSFAERNTHGYISHRVSTEPWEAGVTGPVCRVNPWQNVGGIYRMYYVADAPQLALVDELDQNLDRMAEGISLHAAIMIRIRREEGVEEMQRRQLEIVAEMGSMFSNRQAEPVQAPIMRSYTGLPFGFGTGYDDPTRNG